MQQLQIQLAQPLPYDLEESRATDMHRFIDLFAGAGGMSEGFVRAGFIPVAHVESNKAACLTLTTRVAYHWLKERQQLDIYHDYLRAKIGRKALISHYSDEVSKAYDDASHWQEFRHAETHPS